MDDTGIADLTDDTFWYHDTTEYRDADDDTCHELKRVCSEMITVAPAQVHKKYQRTYGTFSYASQCFTVSKFNLGIILSSSIATVDTAQDIDVIVDRHLTMSMHVSSVCRGAYCFLCQLRQVVRSVSIDASKTSSRRVSSLLQPLFYTAFPTSCMLRC